jgi:hypothetical protein
MLKFRKSIKLAKGVKLNIGKKGISSVSVGGKGLTLNASKRGVKATTSIAGTGVSASDYIVKTKKSTKQAEEQGGFNAGLLWVVAIGIIGWVLASALGQG